MSKDKPWLKEQLKTTRNLCDVSLLLLKSKQDALLPTILELLLSEAQQIVNDYCIVRRRGK